MSKKNYILFILTLLTITTTAQTWQNLHPRVYFETEGIAGNTWTHHSAIKYLLRYPPAGANLKLGIYGNGNKKWQQDLNYPRYGLGYQFADLGSKILGHSHAVYLFISSDFIKKKKWSWSYDMGAGIGFIDNPYDAKENPLNIVNGSVANAFLRISSGINLQITPKHTAGISTGLFHLSNGNTSQPNWGINTVYMSASWQYKLTDTLRYSNKTDNPKNDKKFRITAYSGAGYKDERPVTGNKYTVIDVHVNAWRQFRSAYSWGGGITVFYDQASRKLLWRGPYEGIIPLDNYEIKKYEYLSLAAQGGFMLNMHPVYFSFEFGVYLYSAVNRDIFNRWLLEVQLAEKLRIFGGLKSRFGKADFIEYGLAYDIFKRNW